MNKTESMKIADACRKFEQEIIKLCEKHGTYKYKYEANGAHGYSIEILIKKDDQKN